MAHVVWQRFGDVACYVEPFFGSGAVLLSRPHEPKTETVNDKDGMICNFWRSVQSDPEAVVCHADYPAIESDLHARHAWLVEQRKSLTEQLEGDANYYDAKVAGWWCWGMSLWIGSGFCSGVGPWSHVDGKLVKAGVDGVKRQRIHLGNAGIGVHRKRIHLGGHGGGVGVHKKSATSDLDSWIQALSTRLRRVRVCCGDWARVTVPSVTFLHGLTGVFLDPPYGSLADRDNSLYVEESTTVAYECQEWCIQNGVNKLMRIALCGYVEEHDVLQDHGWTPYHWKAQGGMGNKGNGRGNENAKKEVIWFSPHCLEDTQMRLF